MKWILATGILVAVAVVVYAWWRAGDDPSAIAASLRFSVSGLERCR